jgi:hypothetical protein
MQISDELLEHLYDGIEPTSGIQRQTYACLETTVIKAPPTSDEFIA